MSRRFTITQTVDAFRFGHEDRPEWFTAELSAEMLEVEKSSGISQYHFTINGSILHGGDWVVRLPNGLLKVVKDIVFQAEYLEI